MYSILYVDDDPIARRMMRATMESRGFFVHPVPTGEVAMMILREQIHFDMLITDVVIPGGMNGFDLADAARKLRPHLQIMYVTGMVNLPRRRLGELHGKLLTKPVHPAMLEREIRGLFAEAA
jgi:CheY-like chemotaxis protein